MFLSSNSVKLLEKIKKKEKKEKKKKKNKGLFKLCQPLMFLNPP